MTAWFLIICLFLYLLFSEQTPEVAENSFFKFLIALERQDYTRAFNRLCEQKRKQSNLQEFAASEGGNIYDFLPFGPKRSYAGNGISVKKADGSYSLPYQILSASQPPRQIQIIARKEHGRWTVCEVHEARTPQAS